MKKKKNQDIAVVAGTGLFVVACAFIAKKRHDHHVKEREKIDANAAKEIQAARMAGTTVKAKIEAGHYDKMFNFNDVMTDFKFYQMIYQMED